jgi:hypothetical protein
MKQKSSGMLHVCVCVLVLLYPYYCHHSSGIRIGSCCHDTQRLQQVDTPEPNGREISPIGISRAFNKSDSLSRFQGKRVFPHENGFVGICYWSLISQRGWQESKAGNSMGFVACVYSGTFKKERKTGNTRGYVTKWEIVSLSCTFIHRELQF